jgi:hypothetical protein
MYLPFSTNKCIDVPSVWILDLMANIFLFNIVKRSKMGHGIVWRRYINIAFEIFLS